jgi:hypothetical protein
MKNIQKASAECKPIRRSTCAKCGGRRSTSAPSLQARRRNAALKLRDDALRINAHESSLEDVAYEIGDLSKIVAELALMVARMVTAGEA